MEFGLDDDGIELNLSGLDLETNHRKKIIIYYLRTQSFDTFQGGGLLFEIKLV